MILDSVWLSREVYTAKDFTVKFEYTKNIYLFTFFFKPFKCTDIAYFTRPFFTSILFRYWVKIENNNYVIYQIKLDKRSVNGKAGNICIYILFFIDYWYCYYFYDVKFTETPPKKRTIERKYVFNYLFKMLRN